MIWQSVSEIGARWLAPDAYGWPQSRAPAMRRRNQPTPARVKERRDGGKTRLPFALDHSARIAAIERAGAFEDLEARSSAWSLVLDPDQTAALYATYSNINVRVDRPAVLAELRRIALEEFGGRVSRNMITSLYLAKRRA